jgi:hypothetical protein
MPEQEPAPESISFDNALDYTNFVIETTKKMLGILQLEASQAQKNSSMSPMDLAHFTITDDTLRRIQAAATMARGREIGLVTPNGNPL